MSQWASVWQRAEEEVEPPANSPTTTCWSVFMGCTQSPASKIWAWQHNVKIKKKKSGFGVNAPFRLRPLRSTTTQWCESHRKEAELREFCIWSSCKHTLPSRVWGGEGRGGNTVNVCCAVICLSRMLLNPADPCGEQRKYPIFYQQISSKLQRHHRGITRFVFFRLWRLNVCLEPGDGFWVKHLRLRWLRRRFQM